MREKGFAPLLIILVIAILAVLGFFLYKDQLSSRNIADDSALTPNALETINFLDYSIAIPEGWIADTSREVESKFFQDDPIMGNTCNTSMEDELIGDTGVCHYLKIRNALDGEKVVVITDTENLALGGGGYVTTTTRTETLKAKSSAIFQGKFDFVYEGPQDNILDLYYSIGCLAEDLCINTHKLSDVEVRNFVNNMTVERSD